jgi:hypothetical protein
MRRYPICIVTEQRRECRIFAPGGAKLIHASLMKTIGRPRNVVRVLAATLVPEHCSSGHCGKLCRWSHLISSAQANAIVGPYSKLCRATQSVKYQPPSQAPPTAPDRSYSARHCGGRSRDRDQRRTGRWRRRRDARATIVTNLNPARRGSTDGAS